MSMFSMSYLDFKKSIILQWNIQKPKKKIQINWIKNSNRTNQHIKIQNAKLART